MGVFTESAWSRERRLRFKWVDWGCWEHWPVEEWDWDEFDTIQFDAQDAAQAAAEHAHRESGEWADEMTIIILDARDGTMTRHEVTTEMEPVYSAGEGEPFPAVEATEDAPGAA